MAQIQINNKTEETELLKEYIVMEKDKLEEGKKTFQEDRDKYEKFKLDLTAKGQQTEDEVRAVQRLIEESTTQIAQLKKLEAEQASKESKVEEEIVLHKASKKFLDLLAIASGEKKPVSQKRRRAVKLARERALEEESRADSALFERTKSGTFVTQGGPSGRSSQMRHAKTKVGKTSFIKAASPSGDDGNQQRPSTLSSKRASG